MQTSKRPAPGWRFGQPTVSVSSGRVDGEGPGDAGIGVSTTLSVLVLCLSACSDGESSEGGVQAEAGLAGSTDETTSVDVGASVAPDLPARAVAEPTEQARSPAVIGTGGDLSAYVGKFPFDAVGGVTWHEHPMVVAGIRKTVPDAEVRRALQSSGGPSAPIAVYEGKVGAWGCQQHNCGDHQWAILVDPRSGATDVCYHNAEQMVERSRWYLAEGNEETRLGNCSVV